MLTGVLPTYLNLSGVIVGTQKAANRLQAAMDRFEAAGGYDADKRIANVLTGLGFKQEDWNKSCSEFSGGWQVFATLCIYATLPERQCISTTCVSLCLLICEWSRALHIQA